MVWLVVIIFVGWLYVSICTILSDNSSSNNSYNIRQPRKFGDGNSRYDFTDYVNNKADECFKNMFK